MLRILSITGLFLLSLLPARTEAKNAIARTDHLQVHLEKQSSETRPHRYSGYSVKTFSAKKKKKRATITKILVLPERDACAHVIGTFSHKIFAPAFVRILSCSIRDRSPPSLL